MSDISLDGNTGYLVSASVLLACRAERDALALQLKSAQDALAAVIAENTAKAEALERYKAALEGSRWSHRIVDDDPWYSCPRAVWADGTSAYAGSDDECNCGADKANAIIDAALHPEPPDAQA